ncbi:MAG: PQQ-dependent sugar dehydrogenase [Gammaproteobacteria bacterium]
MKLWIIAVSLMLMSCQPSSETVMKEPYLFSSNDVDLEARIIYQGYDAIWGFDFLPDGKIIFTEKKGRLKIFDPVSSETIEIGGVPSVAAKNQGGLLDIGLHPGFVDNPIVYLTYSATVGDGLATVLARGKLEGDKLTNLTTLFTAGPPADTDYHFGSRVVIDRNGYVFLSVGDRGQRDQAQSLNSYYGKILRFKHDGSIPRGNPFVSVSGAKPEIWSYGHRNIQGLAIEPETGALWAQEHGPRGGDEINLIKKGSNYGWPVVTYGREYWGPEIGEGVVKKGMESPVHFWVPSIAPSGLGFYEGGRIPNWQGSLFSGSLALTHLNRLVVSKGKVIKEERLLKSLKKRIRSVKQGPDELLYFSTDDGALFQVRPAEAKD